jgi:hypothetical protein
VEAVLVEHGLQAALQLDAGVIGHERDDNIGHDAAPSGAGR